MGKMVREKSGGPRRVSGRIMGAERLAGPDSASARAIAVAVQQKLRGVGPGDSDLPQVEGKPWRR